MDFSPRFGGFGAPQLNPSVLRAGRRRAVSVTNSNCTVPAGPPLAGYGCIKQQPGLVVRSFDCVDDDSPLGFFCNWEALDCGVNYP